MREAAIIVPKFSNRGNSLHNVLRTTEAALVAAFGGCTAIEAAGSWQGSDTTYREAVVHFTVAYEPCVDNNMKLFGIAQGVVKDADQEAVYIRYADGEVKFVTPAHIEKVAA